MKAAAAAQWRPASRRAVLRALWSTNLAEELQYRGNFVASVLGTIFWLAVWWAIYRLLWARGLRRYAAVGG